MQLGKAILGAIIGALVGIGLLLAVYLLFRIDAVWLAIPVALITGLAVRMMVSTKGHASYLRGAITAVVALAAYVAGWQLAAVVATKQASAAPKPIAIAADESAVDDEKSDASAAEPVAPPPRPLVDRSPNASGMRKIAAPGQSPWDYAWLAIAALVAYELGRGSGMPAAAGTPSEPAPGGTHPDA